MLPNYNPTRRFHSKRQAPARTPTRKLLVFTHGREQYAIAIERVHRVLNEFTLYGSLENGLSLVQYEKSAIAIFDLSTLFLTASPSPEYNYLIVCTLATGDRLGIPIPQMPRIFDIPESKFEEIPELYRLKLSQATNRLSEKTLPALEKLIHTPDSAIAFYLNLDKLVIGSW